MRDYLTIGATPPGEECAQVGSDGYYERAKKECRAFLNQLKRQFGDEPKGADLRVKGFSHDFGTYYEVVCYYDEESEEAADYAFRLESETPEEWDAAARQELGIFV